MTTKSSVHHQNRSNMSRDSFLFWAKLSGGNRLTNYEAIAKYPLHFINRVSKSIWKKPFCPIKLNFVAEQDKMLQMNLLPLHDVLQLEQSTKFLTKFLIAQICFSPNPEKNCIPSEKLLFGKIHMTRPAPILNWQPRKTEDRENEKVNSGRNMEQRKMDVF